MTHTPLPKVDAELVAEFWRRFLRSAGLPIDTAMPESVEPFGDSVELADELIDLVLSGTKRATAGAVVDYEACGEALPSVGRRAIATDGRGVPRAVLETTEVRTGPFSSVDAQFAWDEGEGDRTLEWWKAAHEAFFRRVLPALGHEFDDSTELVFERFDVAYSESPQ